MNTASKRSALPPKSPAKKAVKATVRKKRRIKPLKALPIFIDAFKVYLHTHGTIRAASLSYTSLLAVVPLVILLTSISMALGMADLLTDHLPALNTVFGLNLPLEQILPILENAQKIKLSRLGLIVSIGLFVTFIFGLCRVDWGSYRFNQ